jgi:hypothetical protein
MSKRLTLAFVKGFNPRTLQRVRLKPQPNDHSPVVVSIHAPCKGCDPELGELVDGEKAEHLISEIELADIPKDIKAFLTKAAYRHYRFNYRNIAEYYAHAEPEVQALMEKSALVIIDFSKAIEYGYIKLRNDLEQFFGGGADYS